MAVVAARAGEGLDAGLKAFYAHDDGWRDASGFDEEKLNATIAVGDDPDTASRFDLAATNLDQETAGFVLGKNAYRDDALSATNPNPEAYRDAHAVRVTGLLRPQLALPGRLELRPYARTSRMDFLQHFLLGQPVERNGQESVGLMSTLAWNLPERWSLVTGVDLEWADSFLLEVQDGPTTDGSPAQNVVRPAGKHYDYTVTSTVGAAYGQLEFALTENLYVGAGVRLEHVGYDYDNRMLAGNTDENGVPCTPTGCLYSRPADREDSFFERCAQAERALGGARRTGVVRERVPRFPPARDDGDVPVAAHAIGRATMRSNSGSRLRSAPGTSNSRRSTCARTR